MESSMFVISIILLRISEQRVAKQLFVFWEMLAIANKSDIMKSIDDILYGAGIIPGGLQVTKLLDKSRVYYSVSVNPEYQ
ncbi:hypothetical protein [Butyrivibrio sp. AE2005]|uniref:hypothetical protein n=1 Tax=Butyrivibrio sp. AE2005 TaxID=1496722 RepID=UPI00055950A7|nr:hypothetical protein [Butyrivibrio sp. AE2005]